MRRAWTRRTFPGKSGPALMSHALLRLPVPACPSLAFPPVPVHHSAHHSATVPACPPVPAHHSHSLRFPSDATCIKVISMASSATTVCKFAHGPLSLLISSYFVPLISYLTASLLSSLHREESKKAWVAIVVGCGCGLLTIPYVIWLRKKMFA